MVVIVCSGNDTDNTVAYLNAETKEIKKVAMKTREGEQCMLLAVTKDGRWLVTMGKMQEGETERLRYALIAPDDLFADGAPYTEVEAYENKPVA